MYKALVQMPLLLNDNSKAVVEAEIALPDWYAPAEGQWMNHEIFSGLMPLGPVIYDDMRSTLVLTTRGTTYDYTRTLNEWLELHPRWVEAKNSFIEMRRNDEEE